MIAILSIVSSFGGGALVGGALAAFVTLVKIFPRLVQYSGTPNFLKLYEDIFIISSVIFTRIYFDDFSFSLDLGKPLIIIIGLVLGMYIGLFSSALAETFNVIPVIAKKFKIKKKIRIVLTALLLGKVCGALYYFLIFNGG